uniref:Protein phosphatase 2C like domain containing 1 n=1 Tax=Strix occidentalis caurina TaxID=311401 RepID=A0A8D0FCD1_STROC
MKIDNKTVLAQRRKLISKLTTIPKYSETHRQKIDYSFEFLIITKVSNSLIKALSICQDKNSTWQGDMEDRFIVLDNYGNKSDTCFLGLVDGSHGVTAAETVAAELPLLFLDQLAQMDSSYRKSKDEHVCQVSKVRWSGCSAVTCLVERIPSKERDGTEEEERKHFKNNTQSPLARTAKGVAGLLHIANIGNAHAFLCKNGKSHRLSKEHSASNVSERKRVLQNGGNISTNEPDGLVKGYLRTTRGLGHHGDPVLKRSVIPVPHTVSVPIDDTCQFLILASNGLWAILDYNEVLALTLTTFTRYLRMYECVQQNGTSPYKCQYLMPLTEDNLNDSKAINDLEIKQSDSSTRGGSKELKWFENIKVYPCNSFQPQSQTAEQEETHTDPFCSNCKSQTAGRGTVTSETLCDNAASYISEQLVKAALAAGSRDNITILIVLLNGCDKIPNYLNI